MSSHPWDTEFRNVLRGFASESGEGQGFKSRAAGAVTVDALVDEDELDILRKKFRSSDLHTKVPNIKVTIGGKTSLLTWTEAYNLAQALLDMTDVCYYG